MDTACSLRRSPRRAAVSMMLLVAVGLAACAKQPDPEAVRRACLHEMEISFWQTWRAGLEKKGYDEAQVRAARRSGELQWKDQLQTPLRKQLLSDCIRVYADMKPRRVSCVLNADDRDQVNACVGGPTTGK